MPETPQTVRERAEETRKRLAGVLADKKSSWAKVDAIIEQALNDERERCAKIAENHECTRECEDHGMGQTCPHSIATAIRTDEHA